ncbi:flavodoxin [Asinibacterium sp. OR53]|uniref:flavodoxin n=1 Tax=Asinibacterium sp. OR53 TaxID=925409 RepID=UPI0004AE9F97|nr:flavodoxin [Asinibacterium sp. OR53]
MNNSEMLIIYFSHSNNTKQLAEWIQSKTNAGIIRIEPEVPYPSGYQETIDEMSRQNKGKILPPFKKVDVNIQDYDTIFFGYPVWDMRLPPVVRTFLRDNDFSGKTILPFNTHAGYGTGKSVSEIKEFAPNAKVADAFSVRDSNIKGAKNEVEKWVGTVFH